MLNIFTGACCQHKLLYSVEALVRMGQIHVEEAVGLSSAHNVKGQGSVNTVRLNTFNKWSQ